MGEEKPCCPAAAARRTRRIRVGGYQVGIAEMDRISEEVHAMGLGDDEAVADALLGRARIYNYIPPGAVEDYRTGLLEEYRRTHPRGER